MKSLNTKNVALDALRALAALYVFFHHTLYSFDLLSKNSFWWKFFNFGQEAVITFFILSGYVIAKSMYKNHYSFKIYFLHRFTRIYSVVIFAYVISFLCWRFYSSSELPDFTTFLLNFFMLQDLASFRPGTFVEPLFGNNPLWSLSYEWWFYMIFFVHYYYLLKTNRNQLIHILSAFIISLFGMVSFYFISNQISTFLMYYFVWFSGVTLYYASENSFQKIFLFYIFLLTLFIGSYILLFSYGVPYKTSVVHPYLTLRHFISLFILLILFLPVKVYFKYIKKIYIFKKILVFLSHLSSISFALYLIHYPIKNAVATINIPSIQKLIVTMLLTYILAFLIEKKIYPSLKNIIFNFFSIDKLNHYTEIK